MYLSKLVEAINMGTTVEIEADETQTPKTLKTGFKIVYFIQKITENLKQWSFGQHMLPKILFESL